jgi:hypothetical protein
MTRPRAILETAESLRRAAAEAHSADLFGDLQNAELCRSLKHSDFLRAVQAGAPLAELDEIKSELDALAELASAALARVLGEIRSRRSQQATAEATPAPAASSGQ